MRKAQATVVGDSDAPATTVEIAEEVGALLAKHGIVVVTGGRSGVMEAACRGAMKAGGLTVGIIPTEEHADANPWCTIVVPTGLSHARNALTVLAGDFVIALGGAAGTLSEISLAWIYNKPILTLQGSGGWADKLAGTSIDHRRTEPIISCSTLEQLESETLSICRKLNLEVVT
jgi:uncharacterized protein (TIGR00725 family)